MSRRGKSCRARFGDSAKQEVLNKNWEPPFERDDECWLADENTATFVGPFRFSYYSPQSCVVLGEHDGRTYARRIHFMKKQRIFKTEAEAKSSIMLVKVLQSIDLKLKMEKLNQEILELSDGRIKL